MEAATTECAETETEKESKTKGKTPRKIIPLPPKNILGQKELKSAVDEKLSDSTDYAQVIQTTVDNVTMIYKQQIMEIIGFVDNSLELNISTNPTTQRKNYEMKFNLTNEELNFLAIKIPTACLFVQEQINDRALDSTIAEHIFDDAVTEELKKLIGQGDAKERMRFAEQEAEIQKLVSIIKKQVYQNLKTLVDRADKIYDGVKKVLDGKNRERDLTNKGHFV